MQAVEDLNRLAQEKAKTIVAAIPALPEVSAIDVRPYIDNTGDAALQLTFRLHPGTVVDAAFIKQFNEFAGRVQTAILHSDVNRFPYTRLEEAA